MDKKETKELKEVNYVHKQTIHAENIGKERKYEMKNFKYEFTFSPFTCKMVLMTFYFFYFFSLSNN